MPTKTKPTTLFCLATLIGLLTAGVVIPLHAQQEQLSRSEPVVTLTEYKSELKITEKFAQVIEFDKRIRRVDGFDPEVVSVTALSATRIRVQAVKTGVTTMTIEDEDGQTWTVDLFVTGDVRHLQAYINRLFPDANVEAVEIQESVVLRGWVTQPDQITELLEVATEFYPRVLNQIKVGGVQQVQLHVKVMEVQRSKIRRLGMNFVYLSNDGYLASTPGALSPLATLGGTVGGSPSLGINQTSLADSSLLFGLINSNNMFQGFVQALREEGLLKIMAEPTLTTTNGHPASLLNGGEFPILVPAGLGTVGVEFREFGVRMDVVPVILGEGRLRLELQPEVSEKDFANAINVNGVVVPGLTVRRANTQVEMQFGETLMIAGLISRRHTAETSKIPFFGELPWIGSAFSRKRFDEVETELVILVTPEYVAPLESGRVPAGGPGQFTAAPTERELFWHQMIEVPNYGDECEGCLTPGPTGLVAPGGRVFPGSYPTEAVPSRTPAIPAAPPAPAAGESSSARIQRPPIRSANTQTSPQESADLTRRMTERARIRQTSLQTPSAAPPATAGTARIKPDPRRRGLIEPQSSGLIGPR